MTPKYKNTGLNKILYWAAIFLLSVGLLLGGGFTLRQALVLATVSGLPLLKLSGPKDHNETFVPFWLRVEPKLSTFYEKLELVHLLAKRDPATIPTPDPEFNPITFTTLRPGSQISKPLVFLQPWKYFSADYNVAFPLHMLVRPLSEEEREMDRYGLGPWPEEFFIQAASGTYLFGLRVNKVWWRQHLADNPEIIKSIHSQTEVNDESRWAQIDVILGTLPIQNLNNIYAGVNSDSRNRLDMELTSKGWEPYTVAEVRMPFVAYKHEFMVISHAPI